MALKCPKCGSTDKFIASQYIEYHDALFDGSGQWIDDVECYESFFESIGSDCTCCACNFHDEWDRFEEEASKTNN